MLVEPTEACPTCGERDSDKLEWDENACYVTCECGRKYEPGSVSLRVSPMRTLSTRIRGAVTVSLEDFDSSLVCLRKSQYSIGDSKLESDCALAGAYADAKRIKQWLRGNVPSATWEALLKIIAIEEKEED